MTRRRQLLSSTFNISAIRLLVQIIAMGSGIYASARFGATSATDNYYTALILPAPLAVLAVNILSNFFAPIYLKAIHEDPSQRQGILSSFIFIGVLVFIGCMLLSLVAVPIFVWLRQPIDAPQAVVFGLGLALLAPLVGSARLLSIICETETHYITPAVATLLNPIVFIGVLILTSASLGIYSLLVASLVAHFIEFTFLLYYAIIHLKIQPWKNIGLHPSVKTILLASPASALTFIAIFLIPLIDRGFASSLGDGALTIFHYGERFVVAFDTLILSGVMLVIYYHWSKINAEYNIEAVISRFNDTLSVTLFVTIPLIIGGAFISRPLISVFFERGAFTAVDESAQVLAVLLLSLIFWYPYVLMLWLIRISMASQIQTVIAINLIILNSVLNFILVPSLGILGIVTSTLLARFVTMCFSYMQLRRHFRSIDVTPVLGRFTHTCLCTGFMSVALYLGNHFLQPLLWREHGLIWQMIALGIMFLIGTITYSVLVVLTRHADAISLINLIRETRLNRASPQVQ